MIHDDGWLVQNEIALFSKAQSKFVLFSTIYVVLPVKPYFFEYDTPVKRGTPGERRYEKRFVSMLSTDTGRGITLAVAIEDYFPGYNGKFFGLQDGLIGPLQSSTIQYAVIIQKEYEIAAGVLDAKVPSPGTSKIPVHLDNSDLGKFSIESFHGSIGGSIVDHQDLQGTIRLGSDTAKRLPEIFASVPVQHKYCDERR